MVRLRNDKITIRPIAGTRPRGINKKQDIFYKKDLLKDKKELSEHLMLLDLGRNDVGKVSKILLFILIVFIILFPFADEIYTRLAAPLIASLPTGSNMIAIDVASPFFIPFKLVLILSIFITIPFILYHLWRFIAPGLYDHEKKLVFPHAI